MNLRNKYYLAIANYEEIVKQGYYVDVFITLA